MAGNRARAGGGTRAAAAAAPKPAPEETVPTAAGGERLAMGGDGDDAAGVAATRAPERDSSGSRGSPNGAPVVAERLEPEPAQQEQEDLATAAGSGHGGAKRQRVAPAATDTATAARARAAGRPAPGEAPSLPPPPPPPPASAQPDVQPDAEHSNADAAEHAGVSSLDRERATIMARNAAMLAKLGLTRAVADAAAAAAAVDTAAGGGGGGRRQASQRGVGAKRGREGATAGAEAAPRRVSLRLRGVTADVALAAGVEAETANGGVVLAAGALALAAARGGELEPERQQRRVQGDLPFASDNAGSGKGGGDGGGGGGRADTDAAFLALLRQATAYGSASDGGGGGDGADAAAAVAGGAATGAGGAVLSRLGLAERDVAKVTKDGVTHVAWLPGSERLLLAAGDKGGRVGLWDVAAGAAEDTDGVLSFSPHDEYVSGMRWLGRQAAVGGCRLVTASYDGTLRALDLGGAGAWLRLPGPRCEGEEELEFSALDVSADGRTAFLGDPLGRAFVVDLRAPPAAPAAVAAAAAAADPADDAQAPPPGGAGGAADAGGGGAEAAAASGGRPVALCEKKVNTLHLEPTEGRLLAASASDGAVRVYDVRRLAAAAGGGCGGGGGGGGATGGKAAARGGSSGGGGGSELCVLRHGKSCHAAYWATDGSHRLLSTSFDDTVRVWADPGAAGEGAEAGSGSEVPTGSRHRQLLSIAHNNQTGRWITPFRAVWSAACDAVLVGCMRRGVDVMAAPLADGAGGKLLATLTSEYLTAIPSRLAPHPTLPVLVAATSSGRCHVWR